MTTLSIVIMKLENKYKIQINETEYDLFNRIKRY